MSDFLYTLITDSPENNVIFTNEKDAINASYENPNSIINIYKKSNDSYINTFNYYKSAKFY